MASCLRELVKVVLIIVCLELNTGFVKLFPTGAHLPATPQAPEVKFIWDGSTPNFEGKDSFRDGAYANLSDEDLMLLLLNEAANTWNSVPGSYLKIKIEKTTSSVGLDEGDHVNAIVTADTGTYSAAAHVNPITNDDKSLIIDCDMTIAPRSGELKFLLYAMVHELGHCLGLGHAHDNYNSIMGYSRTPQGATLSTDDKAGVIALYPDAAFGDPKVKETIPLNCGEVALKGRSQSNSVSLLLLVVPGIFVWGKRRTTRAARK